MSFKNLRINYNGGKHTLPIWAKKLVEAGQLGVNEAASNNCLHLVISLPAISYASSFLALGVIAKCLGENNPIRKDKIPNIEYWDKNVGKSCLYTPLSSPKIQKLGRIESIKEMQSGNYVEIKTLEKERGHVRSRSVLVHEEDVYKCIQIAAINGKLGTTIGNNASHNDTFTKEVLGGSRFEKLKSNQDISLNLVDSNNRFKKETEEQFLFANNRIGCLADLILPSNTYRHRHSKTCKFFCSTKSLNGKILESDFLILSGSNSIIRGNSFNAKCVFYLLSKTERNFDAAKEAIEEKYFNRNTQRTGPKLDPEKHFEILTFYT